MTRIFLALMALLFTPYGLYCLFVPETLQAGGLLYETATGSTEIRAMYGGLQTAVGLFAAWGALAPERAGQVLPALFALFAGLALGRLFGVVADGDVTSYTGGALVLEIVCAAFLVFLLRRGPEPA